MFDFAGVLAQHQSEAAKSRMVAVADAAAEGFWASYWKHRPRYDIGGVSAERYWSAVGSENDRIWDSATIRELTHLDVASWLDRHLEVMALTAELAEQGLNLAVLSNAPIELAQAVDDLPWLADFSLRLFSSRLKLIKPDVECYTAAIALLGAEAAEVLFIDDRVENVLGAERAGIAARVFTDPQKLRDDVARWLTIEGS